jgi:hypothetical protein
MVTTPQSGEPAEFDPRAAITRIEEQLAAAVSSGRRLNLDLYNRMRVHLEAAQERVAEAERRAELAERRARRAKRRAAAARKDAAALRASTSFKLGNAIVRPPARLRRLLRRH